MEDRVDNTAVVCLLELVEDDKGKASATSALASSTRMGGSVMTLED